MWKNLLAKWIKHSREERVFSALFSYHNPCTKPFFGESSIQNDLQFNSPFFAHNTLNSPLNSMTLLLLNGITAIKRGKWWLLLLYIRAIIISTKWCLYSGAHFMVYNFILGQGSCGYFQSWKGPPEVQFHAGTLLMDRRYPMFTEDWFARGFLCHATSLGR